MKRNPQNDMPNPAQFVRRYVHRSRWPNPIAIASLVLATTSSLAQVILDGGEYKPIGTVGGDQNQPCVILKTGGGLIVWNDGNDGSGVGVRGRLLGSQSAGLMESFSVNQTTAEDQENPTIAAFRDGSYLIVWQSGKQGEQQILGRRLSSSGVFLGAEFPISGPGANRDARVATISATEVAVAWTAKSADGNMEDVVVSVVGTSGATLVEPKIVNLIRAQNQRDVAISATENGNFLVSYVSEDISAGVTTKIVGRIFAPNGVPVSGEFGVSTGKIPALSPSVLAVDSGWIVSWSQLDRQNLESGWDVYAVRLNANGVASGSPKVVNERTIGAQIKPRLAAFGGGAVVVYESVGIDGFGIGVGARMLDAQANGVGAEIAVNTATVGDQVQPTVASSGDRLVVAWSSFGGVVNGMEIKAQRLSIPAAPLAAPSAPYLTALSSGRLLVAWAKLDGVPVKHYEVSVNGGINHVPATDGVLTVSGLAPSSQHSISLAYVLADGRRSPESPVVIGRTWSEDLNANGLPDDWEALHFGSSSAAWPDAGSDSDGDGRTNREEFLSGTSPVDPNSVLVIRIAETPQGRMLNWNTQVGGVYQIQTSNDLAVWNDLGGKRLAAESQDSVVIGAGQTNTYFRINFHR